MQSSNPKNPTQRPTLSSRLSRTVPQYLVRLTNEPTNGLHYIVRHAQARTAPTLTAVSQQLQRRSRTLALATMDAADATSILGDDMRAAAESLTRIDEMLSAVFSDDTS